MFKKLQKYLLVNQPLLWNTRIVPLTCILAILHMFFFALGFYNGKLDFNQTNREYSDTGSSIIFFFIILISIILTILWLIYYFKNNAFKSFYPKNNLSLFKEWMLTFSILFFICSMPLTYQNGVDLRIKSYYSENEAKKRCEIISKASIFYGDNYDSAPHKDSIIKDTLRDVVLDYMIFDGKKYSLESLINKDCEGFEFYDKVHDSLNKRKVKHWILQGRTDSIKNLMGAYFKLVKEHNLKSNLTPEKWFSMVYTPPKFTNRKVIAKTEFSFYNSNNYDETYEVTTGNIDSVNQYVKLVNKQKLLFNRTYLPADQLEFNYYKISKTYVNPTVSSDITLVAIYFALSLSILIFSFRVTSGKSWLISLICVGIINILIGIVCAITNVESIYFVGLIALFLFLLIYLIVILNRKTKKGISGIMLNALMWLIPAFIPLVYNLVLSIIYHLYYYDYRYQFNDKPYPPLEWMENHIQEMAWFNLLFILIVLLILSPAIKKWRGLPED